MARIAPGHLFMALLLFVQSLFGQEKSYDPDRLYAIQALHSDLHFVKSRLEKLHPALYRYTPRETMNAFFDSLDHAIVHPMTGQAFLSLITLLNEKIKDGHTMFLPSASASAFNLTRGRLFPFNVNYAGGKLYITENNSEDSVITNGEEIISINGVATPILMQQLLSRQIRDGYNQTYPRWILNHYFPSYYSFCFGWPARFVLELKDTAGVLHTRQVAALVKTRSELLRLKRGNRKKNRR